MGIPVSPIMRFEDRNAIHVLLVSSNSRLRGELRERLGAPRWQVIEAESGADALEHLHEQESELLLLDPQLPDLEPNEFNTMVRRQFPGVQVLTVNSHTGQLLLGSSSPTALSSQLVELLERGRGTPAPSVASRPLYTLRDTTEGKPGLRGMVGEAEVMQRVYAVTRLVARRDTTVLITGESGTGKDILAQAIHLISPRHKQPFVVVNCAAIPEPLLEAELFGYVKGAFTGAVQSRIGRIHAAHGGTLFLDEIGEMPLALQSKILRFLEQGEVQRLGGTDNLKVDVRVVAATNADLKRLCQQQQFREDLYYRLAVFPLRLPPLRDRMSDLEALAMSFVAKFCPGIALSHEAMALLRQHHWPGNVRELRNVIERASILIASDPEIRADHIVL